MPAAERMDLWANLDGMEAARMLRFMKMTGVPLTATQLYGLTLLATGDVAEATRARSEFLLAELRAGRTPDV